MDFEELKKWLGPAYNNATRYTGKIPRSCKKSSLHQIIKTKEQAERFMKSLEAAKADAKS